MSRSDVTEEMEWFTGEDVGLVFTIRNRKNGEVLDLTSFEIEWKISDVLAGEPFAEIPGVTTFTHPILDIPQVPTDGLCFVVVPSIITINRTPGTYFYDLRRTDPGSYAVLAYGSIILRDPFVDEDPW